MPCSSDTARMLSAAQIASETALILAAANASASSEKKAYPSLARSSRSGASSSKLWDNSRLLCPRLALNRVGDLVLQEDLAALAAGLVDGEQHLRRRHAPATVALQRHAVDDGVIEGVDPMVPTVDAGRDHGDLPLLLVAV